METKSIWFKDIEETKYKTLKENIDTDILIIGGGMTGISLLYELKDSKKKVVLVERNQIGHGVTSRSTAKINYLQGIMYSKIKKLVGEKAAIDYLESQRLAIHTIKDIIKKEKIDCDFENVTSKVYSQDKELEEEYEFLKSQNIPVTKEKNWIQVSDTYVFHPLKYLQTVASIASKTKIIYEHTKITEIEEKDGVYLCKGDVTIKAKQVILACHYPFELFPFFLPIRTYIEKSYIMGNLIDLNKKETFITTGHPVVSKRYYDNKKEVYELILSESHNICVKLNDKKNFENVVGDSKPKYLWSNEDIMTADSLPFIGKIKDQLYLATGYNTWGMTNSVLASIILKDLLNDKENKYASTFDPYRKMNLATLGQYPINVLSNTIGMVQNKIFKRKKWYPKNIKFFRENGKSLATVSEDGKEYTVLTTCPHMGCTLIYNEIEKTWDCPCHASRFSIDGTWLKGPSKKDITYSISKNTKD